MDSLAVKEERFTPEQVLAVIRLTQGNISLAAKNLDTSRSTLYNYLTRYPELKQALTDARESMIDHAESALRNAAIRGEAWAVCFMLKTIGRSRGYIEKHDLNVEVTISRELAEETVEVYIQTVKEVEDIDIDHEQAMVRMQRTNPTIYAQIAPVLESSLTH